MRIEQDRRPTRERIVSPMKINLQELYTARGAALLTVIMLTFTTLIPLNMQKEPKISGYLSTSGSKIIDSSGAEFGFSGVNWFGFETANYAPHGLWSRSYKEMLDQIKELGYNSIRLPFSNAMLKPGVVPTGIDFRKNPDLEDLTAVEVMDKIVLAAGERGLRIILDNHRSTPGGGPESNGLWYTDEYPESQWIEDWKMLAARYKGNPTVAGVDLRNEPHGACWGCGDTTKDWRLAAERGGNAVLSINPELLIIVEGVAVHDGESYWWGGNLAGAKDFPVRLDVPDKLVYSPHDYPETVHPQSWFSSNDYPKNLSAVWDRTWGYLASEKIAPILIGEFGTKYQTENDKLWLQTLAGYIKQKGLSWTVWSLNPNSGDTGGILLDDWVSVHSEKQEVLVGIQYSAMEALPAPSSFSPSPRITEKPSTPQAKPKADPNPTKAANQTPTIIKVIDHFKAGTLHGWNVFRDRGSTIKIDTSSGKDSKNSMYFTYSIGDSGWGGVEKIYPSPQKWDSYKQLTFNFYGSKTGSRIRVEILDNSATGSTVSTAERFEVVFIDDFQGWRTITLPWSEFTRRSDWQPEGAPNNGLNLTNVWGLSFAPVEGEGWFKVERIQLE